MKGISNHKASSFSDGPLQEATEAEYFRLRKLLLGPEYEQAILDYISRDSDAERVADVLSMAITASYERDNRLGKALAPVLNKAIHESITQNPSQITNVMSPIMGPAIRKSVSAALADMVQSLNRILEQSLSARGISWRLKAWRAGVSYGRYVMSQTLRFAVEQVLLVHRETGLLLHSVVSEQADTKDPELVSSMLTAIQDFVSDSFETNADDALDKVQVGDLTLHLVPGGKTILAVAARGSLSPEAMDSIAETYEAVQIRFAQEIEAFSGDRSVFNDTEEALKACLVSEALEQDVGSKKRPWLAISVLLAFVAFLSYRAYWAYQYSAEEERLLAAVMSEEGYLLIRHRREQTLFRAELLRSSDAITTQALLDKLEPAYLQIDLEAKEVTFGSIDKQKLDALIVPEPLPEATVMEQYKTLAGDIQNSYLFFEKGSTVLVEESAATLSRLVPQVRQVAAIADQISPKGLQIMVQGYSDPLGSRSGNIKLSKRRAEQVRDILIENGLSPDMIVVWGLGHRDVVIDDAKWQRRVAIQLLLPGLESEQRNPSDITPEKKE